jgi:hypothetical protein
MLQQQAVVKVNFTLLLVLIINYMMQPFKEVCSVKPYYFSLVPYRFNGEAGFKYRNLNLSYVLSIEERVVQ